MQPSAIDQQLSPAVAYVAALLRSGYSFRQVAEFMAEDGPSPLANVFRRLADDMGLGVDSGEALSDLQRRFPSPYLARVIEAITRQRSRGGNLAAILEPLGRAIRERVGSEGATAAQRARLEQIAGSAMNWAEFEPAAPQPWAPAPPIAGLLDDPEVTEILVDGPYRIDCVRQGQLESVNGHFLDDEELQGWVRRVATRLGIQSDAIRAIINLRMPDDTTMNVVLPPISPNGTAVVIRKAPARELSLDDMLSYDAMSAEMRDFLRACVIGRVNIIVAGGIASGKTTLMNGLCAQIPEAERVISVEATRELRIQRRRLLALEAGQSVQSSDTNLSMSELLEQALLMLPERLIVSELRGAEVLTLARAINIGHHGAMGLMQATSPRDALQRLEQMATLAEPTLPLRIVRRELASAFQLIVQIKRMADGVRRIVAIAEVNGMEGEAIALREIFRFEADEQQSEGAISGRFVATGHRPAFLSQLHDYVLPHPGNQDDSAYHAALESQLAAMTSLTAELLRVGYSFVQALRILADDLPKPIGAALTHAANSIDAGKSVGEALEEMAQREQSAALQLIVGTVLRQRSEGGSLADKLAALLERLPQRDDGNSELRAASERIRAQYGLAAQA